MSICREKRKSDSLVKTELIIISLDHTPQWFRVDRPSEYLYAPTSTSVMLTYKIKIITLELNSISSNNFLSPIILLPAQNSIRSGWFQWLKNNREKFDERKQFVNSRWEEIQVHQTALTTTTSIQCSIVKHNYPGHPFSHMIHSFSVQPKYVGARADFTSPINPIYLSLSHRFHRNQPPNQPTCESLLPKYSPPVNSNLSLATSSPLHSCMCVSTFTP